MPVQRMYVDEDIKGVDKVTVPVFSIFRLKNIYLHMNVRVVVYFRA